MPCEEGIAALLTLVKPCLIGGSRPDVKLRKRAACTFGCAWPNLPRLLGLIRDEARHWAHVGALRIHCNPISNVRPLPVLVCVVFGPTG